MPLRGEFFFHGAVVGGAQDAHVERDGIKRKLSFFQIVFVCLYDLLVDFVQDDFFTFPETYEAVQCAFIGFPGADAPLVFQLADDGKHKGCQRVCFQPVLAVSGQFVCGIGAFLLVQVNEAFIDAEEVFFEFPLVMPQDVVPLGAEGRQDNLFGLAVPFVGIDAVACLLCFGDALVDELEIDSARFPLHSGRSEFDFDRCHYICFLDKNM